MELKRVVVTGLGAVTPVGNTPEETWANLVAGKSGAAPITLFDASKFKTQFACEVKGLNMNDYIDRKEARKMDRYTQLALVAATQAVASEGLTPLSRPIRGGTDGARLSFMGLPCPNLGTGGYGFHGR